MSRTPQRQRDLDLFLLELFRQLYPDTLSAPYAGMPVWLRSACVCLHDPAFLKNGREELIRLSGRSPNHVARVLRHHTGLAPADFVNRARLEYATRRLIETDEPIDSITVQCGFASRAYFYRIFKRQYRQTPRQFRLRNSAYFPAWSPRDG